MAHGEGTVQTTNVLPDKGWNGGESRSGMNPGVGGSNPLVDTKNPETIFIKSL